MWSSFLSDTSLAEYGFAFGLVLLGASFQVATGVGLGLIAGPSLLLLLDGPSAIMTAIVLNLALTICLLPGEVRAVATRLLAQLSLWALIGVPVGTVLLITASSTALKIASGIVVLLAVAQHRLFPAPAVSGTGPPSWVVRVGGVLSGGMTGAIAVPGPIALWTMLSSGLDPLGVRATLRAFFLVAYLIAFIIHLAIAERAANSWTLAAALLPALACGIALGLFGRRVLGFGRLRRLLEVVLVVMGLSLLVRGVWDVVQPLV